MNMDDIILIKILILMQHAQKKVKSPVIKKNNLVYANNRIILAWIIAKETNNAKHMRLYSYSWKKIR